MKVHHETAFSYIFFSSNFCETCSLYREMGDEIVLDSEGEGGSKIRIGRLREKDAGSIAIISIFLLGERGHSASDYSLICAICPANNENNKLKYKDGTLERADEQNYTNYKFARHT